MIKKIYKVTYNEIFKQVKKKSFVAIVAVILLLAATLPFVVKFVDFNGGANVDYLKNSLTSIDKQIDEVKNSQDKLDKIRMEIYTVEKEVLDLMYKEEIVQDDFREAELERYKNLSNKVIILNMLLGKISDKEIEDIRFDLGRNINDLDNYMLLSEKEKIKERDKLIKERDEAKRIVVEKDYNAFLKNEVSNLDKNIEDKKKSLEEANKSLAKDEKNEELKTLVYNIERNIKYLENVRVVKQYKVDAKISYDINDWKAKTVSNLESNMEILDEQVKTEKEFLKNPYYENRKMSFNEYQERFFDKRLELVEESKKDWYSLENNIPQIDYLKDGRSTVYGTMDFFILLTIIVIIVAGAGIVSNEYSKGTVRLLLIRPISRFKILLSKLFSLMVIGIVLVTLTITLLTISSGIAFGFDSFSTPIVSYYNGAATTMPFIKYMIEGIAISSVGVFFITAVVFSISTLAKNTALAVAVSIILYIGALPLTLILAGVASGVIVTSFVPYMNMQIFRLIPAFAESVEQSSGVYLNYPFGVIQLLVISLVLIAITFIVFIKKDVRN